MLLSETRNTISQINFTITARIPTSRSILFAPTPSLTTPAITASMTSNIDRVYAIRFANF